MLLGDVSGLEVDILCRRPDRPPEKQNGNYITVAQARGFSQRLHIIPEEIVLGTGFGHVQKVTTTLAGHLEALGVPRDPGPTEPPAPRPLAAFVAEQAPDATSYLELGNGGPSLYPGVDMRRRDVVRPSFPVDPRRVSGDGLQLYEMPIAEFFGYCADPDLPYDVIVIDGLDAAALSRWFEASRTVAHAGTTWIISARDDVIRRATGTFTGYDVAAAESGDGPCLVVRRAGAADPR